MGAKTVRIGVGSAASPKSTLWTIKVGGSEVYISRRSTFALAKISLHSSGKWRFAINSDRWDKETNRALVQWQRPVPIVGSWVMGPTIVFPPIAAKKPLKIKDQYDKQIDWLSEPAENEERVVLVTFSREKKELTELLEFIKISPDYIKSLPLKDRPVMGADTVWVLSWLQPISDHTVKERYDILARLKMHHKEGADTSDFFGVASPIYSPTEEERKRGLSPTVKEIILGAHNIQVERKYNEGAYVHIRSLGLRGYITRIIGDRWLICDKDIVVDPSIDNMMDAMQEAKKFAKEKGGFACTSITGVFEDTDDVEILPRPQGDSK